MAIQWDIEMYLLRKFVKHFLEYSQYTVLIYVCVFIQPTLFYLLILWKTWRWRKLCQYSCILNIKAGQGASQHDGQIAQHSEKLKMFIIEIMK